MSFHNKPPKKDGREDRGWLWYHGMAPTTVTIWVTGRKPPLSARKEGPAVSETLAPTIAADTLALPRSPSFVEACTWTGKSLTSALYQPGFSRETKPVGDIYLLSYQTYWLMDRWIDFKELAHIAVEVPQSAIWRPENQESWWYKFQFQSEAKGSRRQCLSLKTIRQRECILSCSAFCSIQFSKELDEAHPQWGGSSTYSHPEMLWQMHLEPCWTKYLGTRVPVKLTQNINHHKHHGRSSLCGSVVNESD